MSLSKEIMSKYDVKLVDGWLPPKGECQRLLKALIERAKEEKQEFALWCPMNEKIQHIADKLKIKVYKDEE